jgi:hypothetical protein
MCDAASTATQAPHQDTTATVEQQLVGAAAAASPQQAYQPGPLQQHVKLLRGRSEALGAAAALGPSAAAAGMPAPPADQQQQVVSRQLFSAPQAAAPAAQQQEPQAGQVGKQVQPVASPSPSKKQSMLWSLMHKKSSSGSSSQVLNPMPANAATAPGAGAPGDKTATVSAPASVSIKSSQACASVPVSVADSRVEAQQLQASAQHDTAPAAAGASACIQHAAAASAPAAAVPGISAGAADVVAASMERIASCLEEYLCDNRSPSVSPTRDRSPAQRQHSSSGHAAAAGAGAAGSRDQGVSGSAAAGDAAQHATPKKTAAGGPQGGVPVWSPAAAAAKARMMAAALSPSKLQQVEATDRPTAGSDTGPGEQLMRGDQDSRRDAAGAAVGWVHPGDLRPAAAARAQAAARLLRLQPQLHSLTALQDRVAPPGQPLAHLPPGLRPPPGLGLGSQHQQQQQQQHEVHLDPQAVLSSWVSRAVSEAVGAAVGGGDQQLASLFALACRAVGVDLLQQGSPQAAVPAVTAAALTAAMAAAMTAYQQQQGVGYVQQQAEQWWSTLHHTAVAGRTAARSPTKGVRMRQTHGLGAQLWRPQGCGIDSSSSGAWAAGSWHQDALHAEPPRSPRVQARHSGQPAGVLGLWRQQQQPVSARGQQPTGRSCSSPIRTLQPERGEGKREGLKGVVQAFQARAAMRHANGACLSTCSTHTPVPVVASMHLTSFCTCHCCCSLPPAPAEARPAAANTAPGSTLATAQH